MNTAILNHHQTGELSPIKQDILKIYGREPETLDELARCTIAVVNNRISTSLGNSDKHVLGFAWEMRHSDSVSNSHYSPQGYPTNWGGREPVPRGYPGWEGRVWIRYSPDSIKHFGSEPFGSTLTYTGTGGYGHYNGPWNSISSARFKLYGHRVSNDIYPRIEHYSWNYGFFDYDWPGVRDYYTQEQIVARLSVKQWYGDHRFEWTDPETLDKDTEFLRQFHRTQLGQND